MSAPLKTHPAVPAPAMHPRAARAAALRELRDEELDLLVIGGGITGAGIARDAALRGLRVALVERDDFASGTSSRSSRLIHGGLRYLEHGYLHLVFESSAERRRLLRLAPHLVRPLTFTWPVYRGARVPRWKIWAGLLLYDALALFRNAGAHRRLSAVETLAREPMLLRDGLRGGASYFDAATDDTRLTLATALGAAAAGATVLNHAEVQALRKTGDRVRGALVADRVGREMIEVRARLVVNATGPWSDDIHRLEEPSAPTSVRGTKGVHIAVPRERIGNREALTLLSPADARVMFVLPAGAHAIIGTTDTPTTEPPDDVRASDADVEYLLAAANAFFPDARLTRADVVSAWAGIRPLIASGYGDSPSGASREHAIARTRHGVLAITGGKLTTYRVMAAQAVDEAQRALRQPVTAAATDTLPLPGGDVGAIDAALAAAREAVRDPDVAERLVLAYGSAWREVWERAAGEPALAARIVPGLPYVMAEVAHGVEREMACTLADVLMRRTHIAFETRDAGRAAAVRIAPLMGRLLGWTEAEVRAATADYARDAERVFGRGEDGGRSVGDARSGR